MFSNLYRRLTWRITFFNSALTNFFIRVHLKLLKVELGKNVKFHGRPIIIPFPKSKMMIGDHCDFRSKSRFNLIGVNHPCIVSTLNENAKISIGKNCGFSGVSIGSELEITIGNNVRVGANTIITDTDWHSDDKRVTGPQQVIIEDNVWLGVNCLVLKGVTLGKNSVIGANSVVTKSIPGNVIAAGNPCKVLKNIN